MWLCSCPWQSSSGEAGNFLRAYAYRCDASFNLFFRYKTLPSSKSLFNSIIKTSGLPAAMAHVAGPSLAPRRKKHWTTGILRHPIARSRGRIPWRSTCSTAAPFSSNSCTSFGLPCIYFCKYQIAKIIYGKWCNMHTRKRPIPGMQPNPKEFYQSCHSYWQQSRDRATFVRQSGVP